MTADQVTGEIIAALTNHLWQSTLFALAAGLMAVALRKNRAQIRYALWLSASLKFLLPFALLIALGSHLAWAPATKAMATQAVTVTVEQITQPFPATFSSAPTAPHTTDWLLIALLISWALGFAIIAIIRFKDWLAVRAVVRKSTPLHIPTLKIPAAIEVRGTMSLLEPGVVGFLRPVLLLPAGIVDRLTPPQLQSVLAHEACHVRRRDNLTAALHMTVEAIFWFHPLVWWIGARLIAEREQACDEEVLRQGNDAHVYAESILSVCKFYVESPLTCISGVTGADLKKRVGRIMKNQIGETLTRWRKLILVTAGVATLFIPLVAGALLASRLPAQSQTAPERVIGAGPLHFRYFFQDHNPQATAADRPAFDAASIKLNKSGDGRVSINVGQPGGRVTASNVPLRMLLMLTYQLPASQILGAPNWSDSEHFDIEATAEGNPTPDQKRLMLQTLLADRFKMISHHETRELPVYALVVAKPGKLGPDLSPHSNDATCTDDPSGPPPPPAATKPPVPCGGIAVAPEPGGMKYAGRRLTVEQFAKLLGGANLNIDRPIIDRTNLGGAFDFTLEFAPSQPSVNPSPSDPSEPPSIFTAVQEQLGLKLEPQKGPVDVLVIDHIEQPSSNSAPTAAESQTKFDVASVKPDTAAPSPSTVYSNVPLGPMDGFASTGGLLSATNYPLSQYIIFAYKLLAANEIDEMKSQLPKWANTDRYDIQGRASGNPTKDQYRLMMQALLADRFKLALHFEARQLPVFALVLDKTGKLGPQLRQHPDYPECPSSLLNSASTSTVMGGFPEACGAITVWPSSISGRLRVGARNVPLSMLATAINNPRVTGVARPVLDKTGLAGKFDFVVEFSPEGPLPDLEADATGPPFLGAMKEQLGLKLEKQTGSVNVLSIDHIEQPSPN